MSTKSPAPTSPAPDGSLEKIAYASVEGIALPGEPHEADRLGYNVWLWLKSRSGTLAEALGSAGVRLTVGVDEAARMIRERLHTHGLDV